MDNFRTPGVYVKEIPVFPPSVAEVDTAIPAFIGYTEKAQRKIAKDLVGVPTKIYSFKEYQQYYGDPVSETVTVTVTGDATSGYTVSRFEGPTESYLLYYCVKAFFDNGGGQCYIVSANVQSAKFSKDEFKKSLDALRMEDEPTLIVIPEAVKLSYAEYSELTQAALTQCSQLGDRFAILDVWNGDKHPEEDVVVKAAVEGAGEEKKKVTQASRDAWAGDVKYGAAYYPFVRTTFNYFVKDDEANVKVKHNGADAAGLDTFKSSDTALYNIVKTTLKENFVVMPPSGPVAGVYAATDSNRGVWKAPANVSLADVLEPIVKLDDSKQDTLNVDATSGKSINAIRAFSGKGTLVWGARTLAGNDNEWRYISVRRFFNMVEESVKKSTYWAVFEPNDANTWVKVRGMIENYLTQKWREGALAGATTKEAFFVRCGLGTTMTSQDILEGRMNVEIGMAVVRPAEFIILKFSHKLQTS